MGNSPVSVYLSSIQDNHKRGSVGQFLIDSIKPQSDLSVVSAYFTIYAYNQLKGQLDRINHLRFLFGEPAFIKAIDPAKTNRRDFRIEDDKITFPIESRLTQKAIARGCTDLLEQKAEIRSMVKPNFLHGKMYHITQDSGIEKAIVGSSNFTVNCLGLGGNNNIELNLILDNDRYRSDLKFWFNELWMDNTGLVEDVKEKF